MLPYLILLAILPAPIAAPAPLSRWAGDWELDRARSHFRGAVTRIQRTPTGYRFDLGAVRFTLPDDGAFHSTIAGRETRIKRLGPKRWEREHKVNGRIVDRSIISVSRDDRTLTIAGEHLGLKPERLVREGAGRGLAGTWRSTRLGINVPKRLAIRSVGGNRLRWGAPAEGNWYVVTVGGPAAVNQGPTSTPSATLQVTTAPQDVLRWLERVAGRPSRYGIDRLSSGADAIMEISWPAASPAERQTIVYHRIVQ